MGQEASLSDDVLAKAAEHVDAGRLYEAGRESPAAPTHYAPSTTDARIAMVRDAAFRFT
uniref:Uncharacterized protein n=1 Tax=Haloterrigena alkaliphila TaxID=2816475 RepID=A0A8A2VAX1_9EURY